MPYINIKVTDTELATATRQALLALATDSVDRHLGKVKALTAASLEVVAEGDWTIGGEAVAGPAVHVEVGITEGTNTPMQKSHLIQALHAGLEQVLGALPEASYIVIRELPAGNWGYAGLTQLARRQQASTARSRVLV